MAATSKPMRNQRMPPLRAKVQTITQNCGLYLAHQARLYKATKPRSRPFITRLRLVLQKTRERL